jgi:hypothetical protein
MFPPESVGSHKLALFPVRLLPFLKYAVVSPVLT